MPGLIEHIDAIARRTGSRTGRAVLHPAFQPQPHAMPLAGALDRAAHDEPGFREGRRAEGF